MKILIVEDEPELLATMTGFLMQQNYICEQAGDFKTAKYKLSVYVYDIILLDIGLPDGNGLNLIEIIKKYQKTAGIIIISAKNSLDDKIDGLELGADDYLTKHFALAELNSRIRALVRRKQFRGENIIQINDIQINTNKKTVKINNSAIELTAKEYDLLLFLAVNKDRLLTKEAIAEHLWQDNIDLADNFDFIYTHINMLRKKIKQVGGRDCIKTVYSMGYKLITNY